jgi:ribose transport system permease protein
METNTKSVHESASLTKRPNLRNRLLLKSSNMVLWIFILGLIGFFAFATSGFFTTGNALNVLRQMSTLAVAAFGATFIIISGGIDLSVGSVAAVSGVVSAMAARELLTPLGPELSWAVGFLLGAVFGLINGWIIVNFHIPPIITTLGMMTIARGMAFVLTGGVSLTGVPATFQDIGRGYIIPGVLSIPVAIMFVMFIVSWLLLNKTSFGLYVYAIGGNEEAARLSGIPINKVKTWVYIIGGFTASIAGVTLSSRLGSGQAAGTQGLEMDVITAVVLGGASITGGEGNLAGTAAGVLIIALLGNGMILMNIDPYYQMIVKGLALLLAVGFDTFRKRRALKAQQTKLVAQ